MFSKLNIKVMLHGGVGAIAALILNYVVIAAAGHTAPTTPSTITVSIYHGSSGNSGFEGVATCHAVTSSAHGAVVKYHRCTAIHH